MSKTVTINVTQDDIGHGVCESCQLCPVARAIQRALDDSGWRCGSYTWWHVSQPRKSMDLPHEVTEFVQDFDWDGGVQPFSFDLEVP